MPTGKLYITREDWEASLEPTTTLLFWDCECDTDYMHTKDVRSCPKCKAKEKDMPDAHHEEVLAAGLVEFVEPYTSREAMNIGSQYGALEMLFAFERAGIISSASVRATRRQKNAISKATDIPTLRAICDKLANAIKQGKYQ